VPLGGFASLESSRGHKSKFTLQKVDYYPEKGGAMGNLPVAHTCFNRLDLPNYPNLEEMKIALDYLAHNEILGFGIDE
jgi:hypothetical protein